MDRPAKTSWLGFTQEQARLLDHLDFIGGDGWSRTPRTDRLLPIYLGEAEEIGLSLARIKEAMASVGYSSDALDQLDWWASKRK